MTLEQFLEELRKTRNRGWRFVLGTIRDKKGYCPICAVAAKKAKSSRLGSRRAYTGGSYLGLDVDTIALVILAADSPVPSGLRTRIMEALGL